MERKQREDEQAALSRVAVAVASEQRPEAVFETVAAEVGRVLGADRASILRFDPETDEALVVGVWGRTRPTPNDRPTHQGWTGALPDDPRAGRPLRLDLVDAELTPGLRRRLEAEV